MAFVAISTKDSVTIHIPLWAIGVAMFATQLKLSLQGLAFFLAKNSQERNSRRMTKDEWIHSAVILLRQSSSMLLVEANEWHMRANVDPHSGIVKKTSAQCLKCAKADEGIAKAMSKHAKEAVIWTES